MKKDDVVVGFETSIGPWLGKTVKVLECHLNDAFKAHNLDLTKEQMIVLKRLHDNDGFSQNELAFLTLRDKSSLTRLLKKMEQKGYIYRKQCRDDKRINKVFLAAQGRLIFQASKPIFSAMIQQMEQNISQSEKKQIIETLKKIQSNFSSKIESI